MILSVNYFKPGVPKRYLMFVAALVWLFAGCMLVYKGLLFMIIDDLQVLIIKLLISISLGLLFFVLMFSKIAAKHVSRILNIKHENPCLFSFFNWKSYLMMGSMITLGILLRTFHLVPMFYLSCFYVAMGTPLLLSSSRFFTEAVRHF